MPVTREGAYEAHCGATDLQRISCRPSATRIKSRRCLDEPAIVSRFVSVSNALDSMRPDYAVTDTPAFEPALQPAIVPVLATHTVIPHFHPVRSHPHRYRISAHPHPSLPPFPNKTAPP